MFLATLLLISSPSEAGQVDVADWECAEPLVERNYRRLIRADLLAEAIADECGRAFTPSDLARRHERLRSVQEDVHRANEFRFKSDLIERILKMRRQGRIQLER